MSLIVKIGADTRAFDRQMRQLTSDIRTISSKMASIGTSLTGGLTVPIAGMGVAAIKMGSDFEYAMSQLGAVTNAHGKTLDALKGKAMDMGSSTKYSATEAANAMTELAKAGLSSKDVMAAVPGTLNLASAGGIDLADAATIASRAMNEFGMKGKDIGHVGDVLSKTANMSASSVEGLSASMIPSAGMAHTLGISFEDLVAVFGEFSNHGLEGADAGQKMISMMRGMAAPSKKAAAEQKALGLSFFDSSGKLKSMPAIINQLNEKLGGLSQKQQVAALKTMFGTQAVSAMLSLMHDGGGNLQKFSDALKNSGGYAKKTADQMNNNLKGSLTALQSAAETLAITLYQNLGPGLKVIVDALTKMVQGFSKMSPETQKLVLTLLGMAAAFGPLILLVSKAVMIFGKLRAAMLLAAEAETVFEAISLLVGGPVGLIVLAIMGIIAAVALLVIYWDQIKAATMKVWSTIGSYLSNAWTEIKSSASSAWDGLKSYFSGLWTSIKSTTVSVWGSIKDFFVQWGPTILAVLTGPIGLLVLFIATHWDSIKNTAIAVWNAIKSFLVSVWSSTVSIATSTWSSISSFFTSVWNSISTTTTSVWSSIKTFLVGVWNGIVAFVSPIFSGLASFFSAIWSGISTVTSAVWNYIKQYLIALWTALVYFAKPVFQSIATFLVGVWNSIKSTATSVWSAIKTFLTNSWNSIKSVSTSVWNSIKSSLVAIWNSIKAIATPIWNSLKSTLTNVWNSIKSVSSSVWNSIKSTLSSIWNSIKSTASSVWNSIKSTLTSILNSTKSSMTSVWNSIKSALSSIWNAIKSAASSIWNAMKSAIMGPINGVKSSSISAFSSMKSSITGIWNSIKSTASSVWNGIKSTTLNAIHSLVSGAGSAFTGLKSKILTIWNGIKSGMRSVINSIIGMVNRFINGFNAPAKALNKIPGVSAPVIGHIPALATGGTIMGSGHAIVGEAGPELISKSGSSVKVTPLSAGEKARGISGALGATGGSGGFNGTIEVPVSLDGKVIAKVVAPFMDTQLRGRRDSKTRARGGW
ncbi:phage tail tape measure protein [Priestia megaterium]|uniref:phage tail tape measure protein n=1 Tax=Priestia megaterium TaxID=1404 RepID=UPI000BEBC438|nr:phage tail tape measure protein [Priestia megaterium]PED63968.1 phage tail tape measure protein [Priestia megaterium]